MRKLKELPVNLRKTEYSFDKRLKKLDLEMDTVLNDKIKEFDDSKKLTEEYLQFEKDTSVVDRYREKLKKI